MKKITKIVLMSIVILSLPINAESKANKKDKEEFQNALCLRVERVFKEHNRKVSCTNKNRSYLLKIKDGNLETYPIDFNIGALVFYNSAQALPLIKPTDVTIINVYHESKKYTYEDLEDIFEDNVYSRKMNHKKDK